MYTKKKKETPNCQGCNTGCPDYSGYLRMLNDSINRLTKVIQEQKKEQS